MLKTLLILFAIIVFCFVVAYFQFRLLTDILNKHYDSQTAKELMSVICTVFAMAVIVSNFSIIMSIIASILLIIVFKKHFKLIVNNLNKYSKLDKIKLLIATLITVAFVI